MHTCHHHQLSFGPGLEDYYNAPAVTLLHSLLVSQLRNQKKQYNIRNQHDSHNRRNIQQLTTAWAGRFPCCRRGGGACRIGIFCLSAQCCHMVVCFDSVSLHCSNLSGRIYQQRLMEKGKQSALHCMVSNPFPHLAELASRRWSNETLQSLFGILICVSLPYYSRCVLRVYNIWVSNLYRIPGLYNI